MSNDSLSYNTFFFLRQDLLWKQTDILDTLHIYYPQVFELLQEHLRSIKHQVNYITIL